MANIFVDEIVKNTREECEKMIKNFEENPFYTQLKQNIMNYPDYVNRIKHYIRTCLNYTDMLKSGTDKIKIITLLYKFLSHPIGLSYLINNLHLLITSRNKLQDIIYTSSDKFPDNQEELLSFQKILDPYFFYLNTYTKSEFNCVLPLYYREYKKGDCIEKIDVELIS